MIVLNRTKVLKGSFKTLKLYRIVSLSISIVGEYTFLVLIKIKHVIIVEIELDEPKVWLPWFKMKNLKKRR